MSARGADQKISSDVQLKLANRGLRAPCNVAVNTKNGEVTLTGTVEYPHQKSAAVQAATSVAGVRRVTDQMTVGVKRRF
ncbi:MAG: BON domain-containing protein [Planctomycetaceae bacterium]|nr:BON domain-containing protein [Planctomycetaceae bacterium]